MEDTLERQPGSSHPSDFLSPEIKNGKEYSLKWCEYIDTHNQTFENGFFQGGGRNNQMAINRAYSRAKQPIDKYKPILGVKDKKVRNDPAAIGQFKVLSWENLGIMPKFINVLVGNLMKQNNTVGVKAVDAKSVNQKRKRRIQYEDHVMNKDFYDGITAQTGIPFESPVQSDVMPVPETMGEIDLFMDMFDKEDFCLIAQDMLNLIDEDDQMPVWLSEVFRDLIETQYGVTRTMRVGKKIKRRHCWPEHMVMSKSLDPTCQDIKYIGEYWNITIGKLKEIAGDEFTEDQYRDIAMSASKSDWSGIDINDFYKIHMCYPWDSTTVTVGDFVWWSPDYETYRIDTIAGNVAVQEKTNEKIVKNGKEYMWWDYLKSKDPSLTEESYNKKNPSKVIRYSLDNQYGAMWIKGTKHVFNHGKSKDMLRNDSSVGECKGPFTIYKMKDCIAELMIPIIDNIQINWLQYQHHAAKSRPSGLDIEFSALQDIAIEGAGGKRMTPKQILQLYFDTGILLWRRRDASGAQNNWRPINELQNGLNPAAAQHFSNVVNNIGLMRDLAGLNELTDASTPNSEMGKAVATFAVGATKDALRTLHFAADYINLTTADRTVRHILGMAQSGVAPEYTEALGMDDIARVGFMSDLSLSELGVFMLREPTEEMRAALRVYTAEGVKAGWLMPFEAFEIENESNIYRAIRLMKMYFEKKKKEEQAKSSRDIQENTQAQQQSAMASAQAQMQADQATTQQQIQLAWEQAKANDWADAQKTSRQAFLLQVKNQLDTGQKLSLEQERRMTELMKEDRKGQYQLQVAAMKPKPAPTKGPSKSKR